MKELTYKDLLLACDGENEAGETKCGISISNEFWEQNKRTSVYSHIELINPVVRLYKHGGYVQVDLCFESSLSKELMDVWNMVEQFGVVENSSDDEKLPISILTIAPLELAGAYSFMGIGPVFWTLQPVKPGMHASIIRFIFEADDFIAQKAVDDDVATVDGADELKAEKEQTLTDIERYRMSLEKNQAVVSAGTESSIPNTVDSSTPVEAPVVERKAENKKEDFYFDDEDGF